MILFEESVLLIEQNWLFFCFFNFLVSRGTFWAFPLVTSVGSDEEPTPAPWKLNIKPRCTLLRWRANQGGTQRPTKWRALIPFGNMGLFPIRQRLIWRQWYFRNSRSGHNEGGKVKFLWEFLTKTRSVVSHISRWGRLEQIQRHSTWRLYGY